MENIIQESKQYIDSKFQMQILKMLVGGKYSLPIYHMNLKSIEKVEYSIENPYIFTVYEYVHTFEVESEQINEIQISFVDTGSLDAGTGLYIKDGLKIFFHSGSFVINDPLMNNENYQKREFDHENDRDCIINMKVLNFLLLEKYEEFFMEQIQSGKNLGSYTLSNC